MSVGMLLGSLSGFILLFVLLLIFFPYLSILAYGVGFLYGAFMLLFNMFAYLGASCSVISGVAGMIGTFLLGYLLLKIYNIFKGSSGS